MIKMLHDLLPVGAMVHKYDQKYDNKCAACKKAGQDAIEDIDHLLRCPQDKRASKRLAIHAEVRKKMEKLETEDGLG